MQELIVVAIPIVYDNARKVCEHIENQTVYSYRELDELVISKLGKIGLIPQYYPMTDFMDFCNDQEFDFDGHFISYVILK